MLCWPDGGRRLIGNDGISVSVEPNLFYLPPEALGAVDQLVPLERKVFLPPRDPEDIPVAGEHVALATGRPKKPAGALHIVAMLLCAVGATLVGGFAALLAWALRSSPGDQELWIMVVILGVFAALLAWPIVPLWRRIRSR